MKRWKPEIMAYFDHSPLTNAYTEALNGLIKTANRLGRGYSFEVLRAKVLQTGGLQRIGRPPYRIEDDGHSKSSGHP